MPRSVTEVLDGGPVPLWRHPDWRERFPWLAQGMTGRGSPDQPYDLGLFGETPAGPLIERWRRLREATGMPTAIHSRQVHGVRLGSWQQPLPPGLCLVEGLDSHRTSLPGLLLAVSTADCVPIFIVAEPQREIAVVHAGWRGVAAGALEETIGSLVAAGIPSGDLWLHCGPSICGRCYEVGPEVHAGVHPDRPPPAAPAPIDLRAAIVERAGSLGVLDERMTVSGHCTLCGPPDFFSHRGGDAGRQMGVLGIRG